MPHLRPDRFSLLTLVRRRSLAWVGVVAVAGVVLTSTLFAAPQAPPPPRPDVDMGRMLVEGLKSVKGCLGVDTAQWSSGKNTIAAWFEDREAVKRWYEHPVHRRMVGMAGGSDLTPLEHAPKDTPIMVLATLTMSDRPQIDRMPMPISQISIEMFAPVPGGAYIKGRLAPDTFKVPHMRGLTGDEPAAPPATRPGSAR